MTLALRQEFPPASPRPPPDFVDDLRAAAAGDQTGRLLKYLYRDFDAVLDDESYYVNDTEASIIQHASRLLPDILGRNRDILELGCGTPGAVRAKTLPILDAIEAQSYTANDLWPHHVAAAYETIREERPQIPAAGFTADFMATASPRLTMPGQSLLVLGATIGNLVSDSSLSDPVDILAGNLRHLGKLIGPTGSMIITYDTSDDGEALEKVYNTPAHAAFRREIIPLIAASTSEPISDTDFDVPSIWDQRDRRLSHLLIPTRAITIDNTEHPFTLEAGRPIVIGVSTKFTPEMFREAERESGYRTARVFTQPDNPAVLQVLEPNR